VGRVLVLRHRVVSKDDLLETLVLGLIERLHDGCVVIPRGPVLSGWLSRASLRHARTTSEADGMSPDEKPSVWNGSLFIQVKATKRHITNDTE
jgi:hypothetical protein